MVTCTEEDFYNWNRIGGKEHNLYFISRYANTIRILGHKCLHSLVNGITK
jgi:hypothetical protein